MPELDLDNVDCQITGITSNEPNDGKGAGKANIDWVITGPLTADVRAERAGGGQGREYAITVACTALDGATPHTATETGIVTVPHDG